MGGGTRGGGSDARSFDDEFDFCFGGPDSGGSRLASSGGGRSQRQNIPEGSDDWNASERGQRGSDRNTASSTHRKPRFEGGSSAGGSFEEDEWFSGGFDDVAFDDSASTAADAVQFTGWGDDGSAGKPLTHKPGRGPNSQRAASTSHEDLWGGALPEPSGCSLCTPEQTLQSLYTRIKHVVSLHPNRKGRRKSPKHNHVLHIKHLPVVLSLPMQIYIHPPQSACSSLFAAAAPFTRLQHGLPLRNAVSSFGEVGCGSFWCPAPFSCPFHWEEAGHLAVLCPGYIHSIKRW